MATQVYLVKRYLRTTRRNGQRKYRWTMRWEDPASGKWACESTGTADRTQAQSLQKVKWAEVNGLIPRREDTADFTAVPKPTWTECKGAIARAMEADNLRASYISDALLCLDRLRRMFPDVDGPADITADIANEYKRRRSECGAIGRNSEMSRGASPWTIKGDLATLKAVFGKWLGRECGLLHSNPFESVKPPKCDDPEVRIVSAVEIAELFAWLSARWNNWQLPIIYLRVAALLGWRATEIASIREEDVLGEGYVRVAAKTSKTRKHKYGWLPADLYKELRSCSVGGFAFGRFSDELRRLLLLWRRQPHHAARIRGYSPERLVGWLQDELNRYFKAKKMMMVNGSPDRTAGPEPVSTFTLHDFRRTAITGMQMAGVSEKEASTMVGATPEVIRRHYEKLDQLAIAKRTVERHLAYRSLPSDDDTALRRAF